LYIIGEYEWVRYGEEYSLAPLLIVAEYSDEVAADADEGEFVDEVGESR
jgi:hypothetical protein